MVQKDKKGIHQYKPLRTNWREIDEAIKKESQAEDCMIPMRDRSY